MEAKPDKKLDDFTKKMIVEAGVDKPSTHFTASIMEKIQISESTLNGTFYKPLISKQGWMLLGLITLTLFIVLLVVDWESDYSYITNPILEKASEFNRLNLLDRLHFNSLDNINIHKNVVYALLMLSFFLYIQIIYLKRRIE